MEYRKKDNRRVFTAWWYFNIFVHYFLETVLKKKLGPFCLRSAVKNDFSISATPVVTKSNKIDQIKDMKLVILLFFNSMYTQSS